VLSTLHDRRRDGENDPLWVARRSLDQGVGAERLNSTEGRIQEEIEEVLQRALAEEEP
jgi:hypothetical protein